MDIGDDGERGAAATTAAAAPALLKLRVPAAVKERCQPSDIQQTGPTEYVVTSGAVSFAARMVRSVSCRSRCIRSANPLASQMRCRDLIRLHRESAAGGLQVQMDRHVHSRTYTEII